MAEGINSFPSFLWGNIEHTPDLKIRPGQILFGTALEVSADKAVLLLQGINVVAELETGIIPGERIALQVEEFRPEGKILLKKLDWGENKQKIDRQELEAVLRHFGLQQGKLNQAIVTQILRNRLPVSEQHLHRLTSFAATDNLSPEQAPALVWLCSKNLPLTRETVAAIHNLMENGPDKSSIQNIFDVFSGSSTKETENISFHHLFKIIENLLVNSNDTPETAAGKFRALVDGLGLNHERTILQLAESRGIYSLKDTAEILAGEKNTETSLKYALLKLMQFPEIKPSHALGETALKMLEGITGLQLLNISGQQETAESSSIFLANWVISPEEKLLPLFLKIKKFNPRQGDVEHPLYQIFFLLNTPHLGQVICRLALGKEHLTCGFTVRGREEKKLMDGHLGFLRQRLEHLPWKIVIYPTRVNSAEVIKRTWREEFFAGGPGRVKILDTRA